MYHYKIMGWGAKFGFVCWFLEAGTSDRIKDKPVQSKTSQRTTTCLQNVGAGLARTISIHMLLTKRPVEIALNSSNLP